MTQERGVEPVRSHTGAEPVAALRAEPLNGPDPRAGGQPLSLGNRCISLIDCQLQFGLKWHNLVCLPFQVTHPLICLHCSSLAK